MVEHGITDPTTGRFLVNGEVRTVDGRQVYGSVQNGVFFSEDGSIEVRADGTVEHGRLDDQGQFHSQRTVDGQVLYGTDTTDGGWISDDGKIALDKDGVVQHGLTDPGTKQFLPNGEVRTVDGRQVYGSVQDGVFYSEDGSLAVRSDGTVEHGHVDDRGQFHSQRTVDGQVLYGTDTTDGGWISDDGKIALDKDGNVEHGISTPDGQFVAGGTTHTLPDGTTLYGLQMGGDFYSADGSTIALSDGTVLHGSTDTSTGIFTPNNGDGVYVVSDDGIVHGNYDPKDGSIALSDGSRYMTPQAWRVDLPELLNAIATIKREKDNISTTLDLIDSKIRPEKLSAFWRGPAKNTFDPVRDWYKDASSDLMDILDEMIDRMQKSYDNYYQAESQNLQNMTPSGRQSQKVVPSVAAGSGSPGSSGGTRSHH
ncbi:WXG100 family type VII secretion target [Actinoallomurus sp. NPDC052308]|uniref:WXG100 family type VII secretion target n=1 Tax=Actinoallomurus sp. NPDC052308 TaxID=3155530 RepID=UPI0034432A45